MYIMLNKVLTRQYLTQPQRSYYPLSSAFPILSLAYEVRICAVDSKPFQRSPLRVSLLIATHLFLPLLFSTALLIPTNSGYIIFQRRGFDRQLFSPESLRHVVTFWLSFKYRSKLLQN